VEKPPWEQPGCFRRDCEPHRAWLLCALSFVGLLSNYLVFIYCFDAVTGGRPRPLRVGVVMAVMALAVGLFNLGTWILARRDLALMRSGLMDPHGEDQTRHARNLALIDFCLGLPPVLACACGLAVEAVKRGL
jgi:hypothetical protein